MHEWSRSYTGSKMMPDWAWGIICLVIIVVWVATDRDTTGPF